MDYRHIIDYYVKDKWVAEHDEFGHFYREVESDEVVPSVTTQNIIAKPHLLHWATKRLAETFYENPDLWEKYVKRQQRKGDSDLNEHLMIAQQMSYIGDRDDAGNVGTLGHALIERYIDLWIDTGIKPKDIRDLANERENKEPRAIAVARAAEESFNKYNIEPIAAEIIVGWKPWNMAGTLDLLVYNHDTKQVELWDHKSSNSVDDDYARQAAAYKYMLEKMTDNKIKVGTIRINRLDKWSNKFKEYRVNSPYQALIAQLANNKIYHWKNDGKKLSLIHI